ncbi:MAG: two-component sensor histidine kinase [Flavipsychrobacter sp.]|nr:two-component sensor histidine kinase [Flavipsychrobacter sp.]
MGETEYQIFIVLATLIMLIFIGGIIVFITQYHKKKLQDAKDRIKTEQEHAQEVLHIKLEIQQETMKDISREIHDNIGQQLVLATFYSNQLLAKHHTPDVEEPATAIGDILSSSLADLRSLSKSLLNHNRDIGYLDDLVKDQCTKINAVGVCKAVCTFHGEEIDPSGNVKNFILRIIQEFMQNSLKHSGCKNILIDFDYRKDGLKISISDDGDGFDMTEAIESKKGIGLMNMKKRGEMIGAEFTFNSTVGKGTQLGLFIPLAKLNAHDHV